MLKNVVNDTGQTRSRESRAVSQPGRGLKHLSVSSVTSGARRWLLPLVLAAAGFGTCVLASSDYLHKPILGVVGLLIIMTSYLLGRQKGMR